MVTGGVRSINRKFQDPFEFASNPRLLLLSNNTGIIGRLAGDGSLTTEDQEAILCRTFHLTLGNGGAEWLRARGGQRLTAKPGARWVSGNTGARMSKSDHIFARHILWMYEHRNDNRVYYSSQSPLAKSVISMHPVSASVPENGKKIEDRLLVEGNFSKELAFILQTQSGGHEPVIQAILGLIQSPVKKKTGFVLEDKKILVSSSCVHAYYVKEIHKVGMGKQLTMAGVQKILKTISVGQSRFRLEDNAGEMRPRFHEIKKEILLDFIREHGIEIKNIKALLDGDVVTQPLAVVNGSHPVPQILPLGVRAASAQAQILRFPNGGLQK
jgi:hypothetical protein